MREISEMMKMKYYVFFLLIFLLIVVCVARLQRVPTFSELSNFINKTEADICKKWGSPLSQETIDRGVPYGMNDEEANEWCNTHIQTILWYDDSGVQINYFGIIKGVCHKTQEKYWDVSQ